MTEYNRRWKVALFLLGLLVSPIACFTSNLEPSYLPAKATPALTEIDQPSQDQQQTPDTTIVSPDWQIYFSEPDRYSETKDYTVSLAGEVLEKIRLAEEKIDLAIFEFNLYAMADELIAARQRGVQIRFVTDDEHGIGFDQESGRNLFSKLSQHGILVKDDAREQAMHNKFIVIDDRFLITGSANMTVSDLFKNNNNLIIIDNAQLAHIYTEEFNELWAGEYGRGAPSDITAQSVQLADTNIEVWFSPEDGIMRRLTDLVDNAAESIRFMAFAFTHDDLQNSMVLKSQQGLRVDGLFESRNAYNQYSAFPIFYCQEISVRLDGNPNNMHHKVIIIDDRMVVTGSFNFSNNAESKNEENLMIVYNKDIADKYNQEFYRLWESANVPDAGVGICK